MTPRERIMVALDRATTEENLALIDALSGRACIYKVGMRQYYTGAASVLAAIRKAQASLFLDLKLHDIPATVSGAMKALAPIQPDFVTVHASGGAQMVNAAVEALAAAHPRGKVLAVTILTSMTPADVAVLAGGSCDLMETVVRLAKRAVEAGAHGVVASPLEAAALRDAIGDRLIVTPGVRPADTSRDDQHRVMTPREALQAGADHLVIGRPIHAAADPRAAWDAIMETIA